MLNRNSISVHLENLQCGMQEWSLQEHHKVNHLPQALVAQMTG
uniref:Uncharacterized protein n=1 Tax=Arundo donax TaxID=35708 RepID=A0A0A9EMZ4_ARUDO